MKVMTSGIWVPDITQGPFRYLNGANALKPVVQRAKQRRVCIQAGGHIGLVPRMLAEHFQAVYTFEPHAENFSCLVRNMERHTNVYAARGILGHARGTVGLAEHTRSTGGHNVKGEGNVPTYRIDDMALPCVDAIFLDMEGYEMHGLMGAIGTIRRDLPLLVVEENKKVHGKGFEFGDILTLVEPLGYVLTDTVGEDLVLEAAA